MRRGLTLFASFSAAGFLAVYLLPAELWVPLGLGALIPAGVCHWRAKPVGTLICLGLAAALVWCGAFRAIFLAPARALDGRRTTVTAVVSESPTVTDYGALVSCWVVQEGYLPVRGTLYADKELLDLRPGDRVTALCDCDQTTLRPETRFTNSATYGVFVELHTAATPQVDRADAVPWWCLPRWWGGRLADSVRALFPADVSGLLAALVTGDKSGLEAGVHSDLRRSGIAHLVAVSGMHVCFLVSLLTRFTGFDPRRRCLVCLPVLALFALAVGATPSVLRACLFQLAFLLGEVLGREEDRWTTLFGALALLLLLDPFSAANIGLQMSFGAVAGILLVTERAYERLSRLRLPGDGPLVRRVNFLLKCIWQLMAASLGAMLFTVPLGACYFGNFSLLAPLTNLLVLPVASTLFAATLLIGLAGLLLPGLATAAAWAVAFLARYVLGVSHLLADCPYCALSLAGPYVWAAFVSVCALVLLALFWRRQRRRLWLFGACALTALTAAIALERWSFTAGELTLAALDVGQGQSVVLASRGRVAVIDCGGSADDAGQVCADYLNDRGQTTVDTLILTHYHDDHANGLETLFSRLTVEEVVLPRMDHDQAAQLAVLDLARREGAAVTWLDGDLDLPLGGAAVRLVPPPDGGEENESCAAAVVTCGDFSALITGDMSASAEERLLSRADLGPCPVLIAGHHGSDTATGQLLLDATGTRTALISVGENIYGHPGARTLERLARADAAVYRTDRMGTLTVKVKEKGGPDHAAEES